MMPGRHPGAPGPGPGEEDRETQQEEITTFHPPSPKPRPAPGGVVPFEQVAAAMQMQVEILRQINDRQDRLEAAASDTRRSEMMISSTRALNESFRGMRRVQEKLIDELNGEDRGAGRSRLVFFLGLLALAAGLAWGLWQIRGAIIDTRQVPPGASDRGGLEAQLAALKSDLSRLKDDDKERVKEVLTARVSRLGEAIDDLRSQRDGASRREQDVQKELVQMRSALATWQQRAEQAEVEAQRLTERNLSDQKLITSLSSSLDRSQGAGETGSGGSSASIAKAQTGAEPGRASNSAGEQARTSLEFSPQALTRLNKLLSEHRGSESYLLKAAGGRGPGILKDVLLEIRGPGGALSREVAAEQLSFKIAPRGDFLEMVFDSGSVSYQRPGRAMIRSPFFKNVYKVGVFGVNRKLWLSAGFDFVKIK